MSSIHPNTICSSAGAPLATNFGLVVPSVGTAGAVHRERHDMGLLFSVLCSIKEAVDRVFDVTVDPRCVCVTRTITARGSAFASGAVLEDSLGAGVSNCDGLPSVLGS